MTKPYDGRLSLSAASLPRQSVMADIELASALGLDGVGLSLAKLDAGKESDEEVREALADAGLRATLCGPVVFSILPLPTQFGGARMFAGATADRDPRERVRLICAAMPRLAAFDPVGVIVAPGNSGDPAHPAGPLSAVRDGLADIADAAADVGLRVAFELIGERRGSPLHTLPDIVSFIDDVGRDNVDVLFDVFHSWCEPGLEDALRTYADRVVSVDLNDIRPEERSGFDRELPGRGLRTAPAIVRTLVESGYDGWWNLEVFSDDGLFGNDFPNSYWKLPPAEFGRLMLDAALEVWASATSGATA